MLKVMESYRRCRFFSQVCAEALTYRVKVPATLRQRFCEAEQQLPLEFPDDENSRGTAMVRDISYYLDSSHLPQKEKHTWNSRIN
jgi:hypothetical protein